MLATSVDAPTRRAQGGSEPGGSKGPGRPHTRAHQLSSCRARTRILLTPSTTFSSKKVRRLHREGVGPQLLLRLLLQLHLHARRHARRHRGVCAQLVLAQVHGARLPSVGAGSKASRPAPRRSGLARMGGASLRLALRLGSHGRPYQRENHELDTSHTLIGSHFPLPGGASPSGSPCR